MHATPSLVRAVALLVAVGATGGLGGCASAPPPSASGARRAPGGPASPAQLPTEARQQETTKAGAAASPTARFDPAPWLEDLHALILELTSHYANLDYARLTRRMDLPTLVRRSEAKLRASPSDEGAKRAIEAFLSAFGDAHMTIDWVASGSRQIEDQRVAPCARLGYAAQESNGVDFGQLAGFAAVNDADAEDVPGGILHLPNGDALGVLRIPLFEPFIHPELCEAARAALGLANDAACDEACSDRLALEASNRLTAALERRAKSLAARRSGGAGGRCRYNAKRRRDRLG